jgi:hypothetical protein
VCPYLGGAPVTTDGQHTFYAAAMDIWGNKSELVSASFHINATPPVITCTAAGPFLLGSGSHTVGLAGVDASVSGLDEALSMLGGVVTTKSVGAKLLTFTAFDLAGNQASKDCSYAVVYDFSGFYPPVDASSSLKAVEAGEAISLKFSLAGDQELGIIAAGYPTSQLVACDTLQPTSAIEATKSAGKSGLSYDPTTGW